MQSTQALIAKRPSGASTAALSYRTLVGFGENAEAHEHLRKALFDGIRETAHLMGQGTLSAGTAYIYINLLTNALTVTELENMFQKMLSGASPGTAYRRSLWRMLGIEPSARKM